MGLNSCPVLDTQLTWMAFQPVFQEWPLHLFYAKQTGSGWYLCGWYILAGRNIEQISEENTCRQLKDLGELNYRMVGTFRGFKLSWNIKKLKFLNFYGFYFSDYNNSFCFFFVSLSSSFTSAIVSDSTIEEVQTPNGSGNSSRERRFTSWELKTITYQVKTNHTAANISSELKKIADDWSVTDKIVTMPLTRL